MSAMKGVVEENDEPITPGGRFFLQPKMDQVINCAMALQHPIDIQLLKDSIAGSIMAKHPRFRSLFVQDKSGREYWRMLDKIDIEKHMVEVELGVEGGGGDDDEEFVNAYLADLSVSTPLSTDKPLWEIHVLKARKCCILRLHHSLGDGMSLMSLFLACCRKAGQPDELPSLPGATGSGKSVGVVGMMWSWLVMGFLTVVYVLMFAGRVLWVKDKKTVISGGDGVELWQRKLATATFRLDDMKLVKNAIHNGTINDVLLGLISSGFTQYFDLQSSKKTKDGTQITGLSMVNIRQQPGLQDLPKLMEMKSTTRWGNQFGFMLVPLYLHKDADNPLRSVTRAKTMIDRKKLSLEAYFSFKVGKLVMSCLGAKSAVLLIHRIICNTTFTLTNVIGPQEEIMFAGNPITSIRINSTAAAHAITMHMVTYNGIAYMQILVAKDIIPDPRVLAKCFEDALTHMKNVVVATNSLGRTISNDTINIDV